MPTLSRPFLDLDDVRERLAAVRRRALVRRAGRWLCTESEPGEWSRTRTGSSPAEALERAGASR